MYTSIYYNSQDEMFQKVVKTEKVHEELSTILESKENKVVKIQATNEEYPYEEGTYKGLNVLGFFDSEGIAIDKNGDGHSYDSFINEDDDSYTIWVKD